jgi:hypothetical protein
MLSFCLLIMAQFLSISLFALENIPFLGKVLGGGVEKEVKKTITTVTGDVGKTLSNVDNTMWYVKLFLIVVSALIVLLLLIWIIRLILRKKRSN